MQNSSQITSRGWMFTNISDVTYCYLLNVCEVLIFSPSVLGLVTSTPNQNGRPKRSLFMSDCVASPQLNLSVSERYWVGVRYIFISMTLPENCVLMLYAMYLSWRLIYTLKYCIQCSLACEIDFMSLQKPLSVYLFLWKSLKCFKCFVLDNFIFSWNKLRNIFI